MWYNIVKIGEMEAKSMSNHGKTEKRIKALAYLHCASPLLGCLISILFPGAVFYLLGVTFLICSVWTFVGYNRKWRHVFCSFQIMSRDPYAKMTPNSIRWGWVEKRDVYGIVIIEAIFGLAMIIYAILRTLSIIPS